MQLVYNQFLKKRFTLQILDGTIYNIFEISTKLAAILEFNYFFCFTYNQPFVVQCLNITQLGFLNNLQSLAINSQ